MGLPKEKCLSFVFLKLICRYCCESFPLLLLHCSRYADSIDYRLHSRLYIFNIYIFLSSPLSYSVLALWTLWRPPKWIALNTSRQNLHDKFCISILIYATPRFMWPPHTCLAIAFLLICFDFNERDDWDSIPSASFPRPAAWHVHDIILRAFTIRHLHGVFVYRCRCWFK